MKVTIQKHHRAFHTGLITVLVAGVLFAFHHTVAQAQNTNVTNTNNTNTIRAGRLEAAKLRACQNRQAALNRIMSRMATRAEKQLTVFSTIAERVQTFYTEKGKAVDNYDALVTEVNTKKNAAETQIATLSTTVTIDCAGENPKGIATAFKNQLRATVEALKEYKTSVKNLIVGVRSAQGQVSSNRNTNQANTNTQ